MGRPRPVRVLLVVLTVGVVVHSVSLLPVFRANEGSSVYGVLLQFRAAIPFPSVSDAS